MLGIKRITEYGVDFPLVTNSNRLNYAYTKFLHELETWDAVKNITSLTLTNVTVERRSRTEGSSAFAIPVLYGISLGNKGESANLFSNLEVNAVSNAFSGLWMPEILVSLVNHQTHCRRQANKLTFMKYVNNMSDSTHAPWCRDTQWGVWALHLHKYIPCVKSSKH